MAISSLVLLLGLTANAQAEEPKPDMAIAYRQSVYKMIRWNFAPLAQMVRDQRPWDDAEFARRAARISFLSHQLEEGYPKGSGTGAVTDAKPEIWTNWEDFSSKLNDLEVEARALRIAAEARDRNATSRQFARLGAACKACHDEYRAD